MINRSLLFEMSDCSVRKINANAFRNVEKLAQMKIVNSNISYIESYAMPSALYLTSHKEHDTPFIFNQTRITLIESFALHWRISENEYFTVVNSLFIDVRKRGITLTGGVGHVLFADSIFEKTENGAIFVNLSRDDETPNQLYAHSLNQPTVTLLGLEFHTANISHLFNSLRLKDGKLYLLRLTFRKSFNIEVLRQTLMGIRDNLKNKAIVIENLVITCNCSDNLENLYLNLEDNSGVLRNSNETVQFNEVTDSVLRSEEENIDIIKEFKCLTDFEETILYKFKALHCPWVNESEAEKDTIAEKESYPLNKWLWIFIGGSAFFIFIISLLIFASVKSRKHSGTFTTVDHTGRRRKRNANPVVHMNNLSLTIDEHVKECNL